jgi:hypothetical protein
MCKDSEGMHLKTFGLAEQEPLSTIPNLSTTVKTKNI